MVCTPIGGIPTFLEAKNNFDSSEISEDNLILQLKNNKKKYLSFSVPCVHVLCI